MCSLLNRRHMVLAYRTVRLIANYFSNLRKRVDIGTTLSNWLKTKTTVPQGSLLGPLFFNFSSIISFTLLSSRRYANLQMIMPFSLVAILLKLLPQVLKLICLNRWLGLKQTNGCEHIKVSSYII